MRGLPPLRFERRLLEKVWGGRALAEDPGLELPPGVPIGETWEVVDREEENSRVAEGPLGARSRSSCASTGRTCSAACRRPRRGAFRCS